MIKIHLKRLVHSTYCGNISFVNGSACNIKKKIIQWYRSALPISKFLLLTHQQFYTQKQNSKCGTKNIRKFNQFFQISAELVYKSVMIKLYSVQRSAPLNAV